MVITILPNVSELVNGRADSNLNSIHQKLVPQTGCNSGVHREQSSSKNPDCQDDCRFAEKILGVIWLYSFKIYSYI